MKSLKTFLAESPDLNTIPSKYAYSTNPQDFIASDHETIPTVDFSLLTSDDPVIRSQAVQELDKACTDWGCFQVINHGVPETTLKMLMEKSLEFFNLEEEEKKEFEQKGVFDKIRYGSGYNLNEQDDKRIIYWRDYLKVFIHPEFHCPNKPLGFREVLFDYTKGTREVSKGLISGISTSLGLDHAYVEKALDLDRCFQICGVNLFPPCPQPELAIGLPPHTDQGLFVVLTNNGVPGFEINHKGKWIKVRKTHPNSLLVQNGDHLEIFSNGKYKSSKHRAVLNNAANRISVIVSYGPSLDTVVAPADKLVDKERCPAKYVPMNYKEYIEMQQREQLFDCLERVRA